MRRMLKNLIEVSLSAHLPYESMEAFRKADSDYASKLQKKFVAHLHPGAYLNFIAENIYYSDLRFLIFLVGCGRKTHPAVDGTIECRETDSDSLFFFRSRQLSLSESFLSRTTQIEYKMQRCSGIENRELGDCDLLSSSCTYPLTLFINTYVLQ